MDSLKDRLTHAWNAFNARDPTDNAPHINYSEHISTNRPDRLRLNYSNDRTIIAAIYNRIAIDCANLTVEHARMDGEGRYKEPIKSGLHNCLTCEANIDQTASAFMHDVILSLLDEGCIAIVPTHTSVNPKNGNAFDIDEMRTAKILEWRPKTVRLRVYNEDKGIEEEIYMPKSSVCIIENPFYSIMNEKNSVIQRLLRKLALLDQVDEQSSSGKLDLIIQLPYAVKSDLRKQQADARRKNLEEQLTNSKYGIGYIDATEHITQLNRSLENNLLKQVEYLTDLLYSQLGITMEIMNGTCDDAAMLNYQTRVVEPIIGAVIDEMNRKFLSKTARTQGQKIIFFNDPFKLVPVSQIADIADKFTRNEILSSNELRQIIGFKPVDSQQADELRNKNLNATEGQSFTTTQGDSVVEMPLQDEAQPTATPSSGKKLVEELAARM